MFPHVITMNEKFYVRRWMVFYFEHMGRDADWWLGYSQYWAAFDTPEAAQASYKSRRRRFYGFI